jgi:hypothetical protein
MGYHSRKIDKGVLGEFSKIREEFEELQDAVEGDVRVLVLCELSDLVGAINAFIEEEFKGTISFADIIDFAYRTKQAFEEGERT